MMHLRETVKHAHGDFALAHDDGISTILPEFLDLMCTAARKRMIRYFPAARQLAFTL